MRTVYLLASAAVVLALSPPCRPTPNRATGLGVSVTGLRNDSGSVRCGLYASPNGFRRARP